MFPFFVDIYGARISVWELMLAAGAVAGYLVLRATYRLPGQMPACQRPPSQAPPPCQAPPRGPSMLGLRYIVAVYIAVVAAQLFSYAFDYGTTLLPPAARSPWYYYFSPTAGAKTLYGAVVALPIAVGVACVPWRERSFSKTLDRWTPAMFSVMAVARLGCWMQGCCYGIRSDLFGLRLAPGSVLYYQELGQHLIEPGSPTLAVVPTQPISALALLVLVVWSYRRIGRGGGKVFAHGIAVYSVFRFAIELVRDDPARNSYGPLSTSQWIALIILVAYVAWRAESRPGRSGQLTRRRARCRG